MTAIAHRPGATRGTVYAYSPYGETTVLGPDEGNALQYTGRENDGTGLYYYRARYYDTVLSKRFVAEDPIVISDVGEASTPPLGLQSDPLARVNLTLGFSMHSESAAAAGVETMGIGSVNLYAYVAGDPVSFADPLGLFAIGGGSSGMSFPGMPSMPPVCHTKEDCDKVYKQQIRICKKIRHPAGRAACYAGAMALYAKCLAEAN